MFKPINIEDVNNILKDEFQKRDINRVFTDLMAISVAHKLPPEANTIGSLTFVQITVIETYIAVLAEQMTDAEKDAKEGRRLLAEAVKNKWINPPNWNLLMKDLMAWAGLDLAEAEKGKAKKL